MRIFIENCTLFPALLHHPPSLPTSLATCTLIAHIHLHARPRHCQSGANCNSCHHTLHTFPHSSHSALYSHCTLHTALHTLLSPSPASTDTFCSILHTYLLLCYLQFAINSRAESTQCWAPFRRTPLTHCTPIRIRSKCRS